jgi:uncharacterized protein DUF3237
MQLEHVFDLDLRYEGEYTIVRPHGDAEGFGYAAGTGRIEGSGLSGAVRFSNNPRVRGDGRLLPTLSGSIEADDGARIVFSMQGLGAQRDREFGAVAGAIFESDDERYRWLNESFCLAEATIRGRRVEMRIYRCVSD